MRRQHWALCCDLDSAAHDTRVNTFVEVQNHVLMDAVRVHPSMSMQTMAAREDVVQSRKDRKFSHENFRTMTTCVSIMKDKSARLVSKLCAEMQDVATPRMGKLMTKEVELAQSCLENVKSTWKLCECPNCKVCEEYMTGPQKMLLIQRRRVLIFHVKLFTGDDDQCDLQHCSLGPDWERLHSTIPKMKHIRIITAEDTGNGNFRFICSCGYGFRYQCTCRHVAMLLIHASGNVCAGCDIDNVALRNTAAFAACRDASLIKRTAHDWKGTLCSHVDEGLLRTCPGGHHDDDDEGENRDDQRDDHNDDDHGPKRPRRSSEQEQRLKSERFAKIQEIQDHFYRIKAKLEVAAIHQTAEFWTYAADVDGHLLDAFRSCNGVPDAATTVVANRYRDDPRRGSRPPSSRARAAGGGAQPPQPPPSVTPQHILILSDDMAEDAQPAPSYVQIVISDSDDQEEIDNGGASSSD
jgi:hypothetical protein